MNEHRRVRLISGMRSLSLSVDGLSFPTASDEKRKKCEKINKRAATTGNVMSSRMMCKIHVNVIQMLWDAGVKFPNSIVDSCIRGRHVYYHLWRKTTTYQFFHSTNFSNGNQVDRNSAQAARPTCIARVEIEFEFEYMTATARPTASQHSSLWNPFRFVTIGADKFNFPIDVTCHSNSIKTQMYLNF